MFTICQLKLNYLKRYREGTRNEVEKKEEEKRRKGEVFKRWRKGRGEKRDKTDMSV